MTKQELNAGLERFLTAKNKACDAMTDEQALGCIALYPTLKHDGSLVKAGQRIRWNGVLLRASADLWDVESYDPDHAPALWEEVKISGGIRDIPENIAAIDAFSAGEKGRWKGEIYVSLIDNNTWNPDQYPAGWSKD